MAATSSPTLLVRSPPSKQMARSPSTKLLWEQLSPFCDENGAPLPFLAAPASPVSRRFPGDAQTSATSSPSSSHHHPQHGHRRVDTTQLCSPKTKPLPADQRGFAFPSHVAQALHPISNLPALLSPVRHSRSTTSPSLESVQPARSSLSPACASKSAQRQALQLQVPSHGDGHLGSQSRRQQQPRRLHYSLTEFRTDGSPQEATQLHPWETAQDSEGQARPAQGSAAAAAPPSWASVTLASLSVVAAADHEPTSPHAPTPTAAAAAAGEEPPLAAEEASVGEAPAATVGQVPAPAAAAAAAAVPSKIRSVVSLPTSARKAAPPPPPPPGAPPPPVVAFPRSSSSAPDPPPHTQPGTTTGGTLRRSNTAPAPPPPRSGLPPPPVYTFQRKADGAGTVPPAGPSRGVGRATVLGGQHSSSSLALPILQAGSGEDSSNESSPTLASPSASSSARPPGNCTGTVGALQEHKVLHFQAVSVHQAGATASLWANVRPPAAQPVSVCSKLHLFTRQLQPVSLSVCKGIPNHDGKSQHLLDGQTSQNLLIKFRAKLQPDVLRRALLGMDSTTLDPTMVLQCLGGYPKPSDVELVMNWCTTNSSGDLGMAEAYVHVLGSVPHARLRLEVLNTRHHFGEDVAKQLRLAGSVQTACDSMRSSYAWRYLLHALLSAANEINSHRKANPAAGFKLASLSKFADLNTFDGCWSLLEVVVEGLDASPHGRRYVDQVMALEAGLAAAKEVDLKVVSIEMLELQKGLTSTATLLASLGEPTLASPVMLIAEPAGGTAVAELAAGGTVAELAAGSTVAELAGGGAHAELAIGSSMDAEPAGPGIVVAEWEAVLATWQARFVEAQAQVNSAMTSLQQLAATHCEPVTAEWGLANSKQLLDNLWRFVGSVKQASFKVRKLQLQQDRLAAAKLDESLNLSTPTSTKAPPHNLPKATFRKPPAAAAPTHLGSSGSSGSSSSSGSGVPGNTRSHTPSCASHPLTSPMFHTPLSRASSCTPSAVPGGAPDSGGSSAGSALGRSVSLPRPHNTGSSSSSSSGSVAMGQAVSLVLGEDTACASSAAAGQGMLSACGGDEGRSSSLAASGRNEGPHTPVRSFTSWHSPTDCFFTPNAAPTPTLTFRRSTTPGETPGSRLRGTPHADAAPALHVIASGTALAPGASATPPLHQGAPGLGPAGATAARLGPAPAAEAPTPPVQRSSSGVDPAPGTGHQHPAAITASPAGATRLPLTQHQHPPWCDSHPGSRVSPTCTTDPVPTSQHGARGARSPPAAPPTLQQPRHSHADGCLTPTAESGASSRSSTPSVCITLAGEDGHPSPASHHSTPAPLCPDPAFHATPNPQHHGHPGRIPDLCVTPTSHLVTKPQPSSRGICPHSAVISGGPAFRPVSGPVLGPVATEPQQEGVQLMLWGAPATAASSSCFAVLGPASSSHSGALGCPDVNATVTRHLDTVGGTPNARSSSSSSSSNSTSSSSSSGGSSSASTSSSSVLLGSVSSSCALALANRQASGWGGAGSVAGTPTSGHTSSSASSSSASSSGTAGSVSSNSIPTGEASGPWKTGGVARTPVSDVSNGASSSVSSISGSVSSSFAQAHPSQNASGNRGGVTGTPIAGSGSSGSGVGGGMSALLFKILRPSPVSTKVPVAKDRADESPAVPGSSKSARMEEVLDAWCNS
ncbi:MAG: hypothetical protein WDW36_004881 [Sanguina aurantia]